jgi:hypothetical protein
VLVSAVVLALVLLTLMQAQMLELQLLTQVTSQAAEFSELSTVKAAAAELLSPIEHYSSCNRQLLQLLHRRHHHQHSAPSGKPSLETQREGPTRPGAQSGGPMGTPPL